MHAQLAHYGDEFFVSFSVAIQFSSVQWLSRVHHSVLTVVGDWTLGPIQEPFNTLLTKDLLIHLLLPKRY